MGRKPHPPTLLAGTERQPRNGNGDRELSERHDQKDTKQNRSNGLALHNTLGARELCCWASPHRLEGWPNSDVESPRRGGFKATSGRRQQLVETHLVEPEAEESIGDDVLYLRLPASDTTPQRIGIPNWVLLSRWGGPGARWKRGVRLGDCFSMSWLPESVGPDFVGSDPNGWVRKTGLSR